MLYAEKGDDAPDALTYEILREKPALCMMGRYEQKG
jgi:hypothetical protein